MIGLIFSEVILYAAAAAIGFAAGWRLYMLTHGELRRERERDVDQLRAVLGEAQVRRARGGP